MSWTSPGCLSEVSVALVLLSYVAATTLYRLPVAPMLRTASSTSPLDIPGKAFLAPAGSSTTRVLLLRSCVWLFQLVVKTAPGWDAAVERRDAQDELHSAAQARAWADGDFDADHGFAFDGVGSPAH
jgi:hypothetical protein